MENNYSNWIKVYIIDVLPGLTVATYIIGFIYDACYYAVFGINIEDYISLSEMFLSILQPLIFIITFYLLYILPWSLFVYNSNRENIKKALVENEKYYLEDGKSFSKKNKKFLKYLLIATIPALILSIGINELKDNSGGSNIFLVTPFAISLFIFFFFAPLMIFSTPRNKRGLLIFEAVFAYYIFAVIAFGYSGYINGKFVRDYDVATFEIKTNDGYVFNDKQYRYIKRINDKVFLLEKSKNISVILSDEGITYMKFRYLKSKEITQQINLKKGMSR